ncbi:hypothetical protein [Flagellimonas myxillae]|uniref:hypothetical protein n=1 Tax=Flagellimonas myxillae TaxID=2942214 RepID=UPI00201FAA08|nr:hypothetical protein [Muricauda myxillae]MCL6265574.1 hypothetical protein [Muricauda myxillae]
MVQRFDFNRVRQFVKRDLILLRGTFSTGIFVAIILVFLFCLFNMMWDKQLGLEEFYGIFALVYLPLGLLFTFSLFREFGNPKTNALYLALPVSSLERLVAKWLVSTLVYTIVFSVVALLIAILALIFGIVLFGADFNVPTLFSTSYINIVAIYLFVQPVFMVGAMSFSKNKIGKTLLSLGIALLCFLLLNFLLYAMFNHSLGVFAEDGLGSVAFGKASTQFSIFGQWFYGLIFGPLMLVVAYFKMVEKEV